jgi:hypothetical protein
LECIETAAGKIHNLGENRAWLKLKRKRKPKRSPAAKKPAVTATSPALEKAQGVLSKLTKDSTAAAKIAAASSRKQLLRQRLRLKPKTAVSKKAATAAKAAAKKAAAQSCRH